ncbi:metallophosphoesterase [Nocardioides sp. TF02-7]|uniref:metallophosphoesterase n=1 Tax=Nocardioides sp. TF02-7 TaxID=2917724 RepID=UPI001F062A05|nr:metallophosphoesterase [Nocardioides sp. TF02-7]UMG94569.1 metallophosphoesterase [Nocardioides sp. TF02-7]
MLVIAHVSDLHLGGSPEAERRAQRVLDHVAAMRPEVDVVVVTGDVADHGLPEEYAAAERLLGSSLGTAPVLVCPGNHDVRSTYAAWRGLPADRPADTAHRVGGHLFLMLDSLVPARAGQRVDHGELEAASLTWLDEQLAARAPGEPAVVCLHHPPVPIHVALMDPIRLRDAERLEAVLRRHRDVVAVLVGHAHTAGATTFAGRPLLIGGGTASTVTLDAEELPVITEQLGPTFAVHLADDGGRVVSHWRTLAADG